MYPVEVWTAFMSAALGNGDHAAWTAARTADEAFREFRKRWAYRGSGDWSPILPKGEQEAVDAAKLAGAKVVE